MKPFMMKHVIIAMSIISFNNAYAAMINPVTQNNWNGVYGGFLLNETFNHVDLHSSHPGFTSPDGTCDTSANFSSFYPGFELGYAHELNSKIVLGIEGDFTYSTNKATKLTCRCPVTPTVSDSFTFMNRKQASIRGRIGYVQPYNLLPFLMVGGSIADLGLSYNNENRDDYTRSNTKMGWLAGAGVEWGFADSWSLRADYFYADYSSMKLPIPTIYGLTDPGSGAHAKLNTNNVELALNYWFLRL